MATAFQRNFLADTLLCGLALGSIALAGVMPASRIAAPPAGPPLTARPRSFLVAPDLPFPISSRNPATVHYQPGPVTALHLGEGEDRVLYLGGLGPAGNAGGSVLRAWAAHLARNPELLEGRQVLVVPDFKSLDRIPAAEWAAASPIAASGAAPDLLSEPTRALLHLLRSFRPDRVVLLRGQEERLRYAGPAGSLAFSAAAHGGWDLVGGIPAEQPPDLEHFLGAGLGLPILSAGCSGQEDAERARRLFPILRHALELPQGEPELAARFRWLEAKARKNPWLIGVDEGRHFLVLFRDGEAAARFRVATGIFGCTPEGDFRIIDKFENLRAPDGRVLERRLNPDLGSFWLGINAVHHVTGVPFGLHGTDEPETIGSASSRGCVRLRDEDIASFYPDIPVGTPVLIY